MNANVESYPPPPPIPPRPAFLQSPQQVPSPAAAQPPLAQQQRRSTYAVQNPPTAFQTTTSISHPQQYALSTGNPSAGVQPAMVSHGMTDMQQPRGTAGIAFQSNSVTKLTEVLTGLKIQAISAAGGIPATPLPPPVTGNLPTSSRQHSVETDDYDPKWIQPGTVISENGPPRDIIRECPERNQLDFETNWYCLPQVPGFLTCTRCFDTYISRTNLARHFQKIRKPGGCCHFNVPRIIRSLLPTCHQTGDITHLRNFMTARLGITDCKGAQGGQASDRIKWYTLVGWHTGQMADFASCQACYEDVVLGTNYAQQFALNNCQLAPGQIWICDMQIEYMKRSIQVFSKRMSPFSEWVAAADGRFQLPNCDGKAVDINSRRWVTTRQIVPGLAICETCYYDELVLTSLEHDFEHIQASEPGSCFW